MKLFERYMLKSLGISMAFITVTVSFAGVADAIDPLSRTGVSVAARAIGSFILMVLLSLPNFISIVLPVALLSIILFIYNRMTLESELIVLRAAGLRPLGFGASGTGAQPDRGHADLRDECLYRADGQPHHEGYAGRRAQRPQQHSLARGCFQHARAASTIYVRERDEHGDMVGLLIEDDKDPQSPKNHRRPSAACWVDTGRRAEADHL